MKHLKRIAKDTGTDMEIREGGGHTVIYIGENRTAVPRHNEIGEQLAKEILKQAKGEK